MKFKIIFPTGYQISNYLNDNIDINVVFENNKTFSATMFTPQNIESLIQKHGDSYFWGPDMLIVKDLKINSIRSVVSKCINDGNFNSIFTEMGTIFDIYNGPKLFSEIIDVTVM